MPRKPKKPNPGQLAFGDNIDDLPPLPPAPGTKRLPGEDGPVDVPYAEGGVSMKVEDYARNVLLAAIALDASARARGLKKGVEIKPGLHEKLARDYAEKTGADHTFDYVVLPGSNEKLKTKTDNADELFNEAFGDFELAKKKALEQFTPQEKAEIEISNEYRLDQDIERTRFKHKMTSSKKVPQKNVKNPANWPTEGLLARREEQAKMSAHLRRLYESSEPEQPAG